MKVTLLGTSHGDPTYCRFNTSTLLEVENYGAVLIDAGTPVLAMLIRQQIPLEKLRAIFITHMHNMYNKLHGYCSLVPRERNHLCSVKTWVFILKSPRGI